MIKYLFSQFFIVNFLMIPILDVNSQTAGFKINGKVTNAEGKTAYLTKNSGGISSGTKKKLLDSCVILNGEFCFKGFLNEPDFYSILFQGKKWWHSFILDNFNFIFTGNADSLWNVKITGSLDNFLKDSLNSITGPLWERSNQAVDNHLAMLGKKDTIMAQKYLDEYLTLKKQIWDIEIDFIMMHPNSFVSLNSLYELNNQLIDKMKAQELFNQLSPELQGHSKGKLLRYQLFDLEQLTSINSMVIPFSQTDTSGVPVSINDFKGKYVLIDFWASWCGPCRAENPNLNVAYEKYRKYGFEIISISLDHKRDAWINAINRDHMPWINLSDLEGNNNEVALKYGITSVPASFLINNNGQIIDKNLKGKELLERLSELFEE